VPVTTAIAEAEAGNLGYDGPVRVEWFANKHPGFGKEPLAGKPTTTAEAAGIGFAADSPPPAGMPKTFAGRWTAKIRVPADGFYAFVASSDEGVTARLDGKPLIDAWRITGRQRLNDSLAKLTAGSVHELQVEWFTYSRRPAVLRFAWKRATAFEQALETLRAADAVVLCAGFNPESEGEGNDRTFAPDPLQQVLLEEIPRVNARTIVTLFGGAGIDCQGWLDRVPGLLHVWYPGQEGGTAVAEILSGAVNPSGKLPLTMPKRIEDHPSHPTFLDPADMAKLRANYGEGIFVGYRGYDARGVEPLYAFGHGLSYTTFAYDGLAVEPAGAGAFTASFRITNTGARDGAEIAQLYVAPPAGGVPRPPRELKGFARVELKAGASARVTIPVPRNAFAHWSSDSHAWTIAPGTYGLAIGASSRDLRLSREVEVAGR
jgi:beta-glucosidase